MFCRPNSLMISRSLLCLLAVLLLVICCLLQLISGRLKSPAMTTEKISVCEFSKCITNQKPIIQGSE